jgi:hypothetical protein
MPFELRVQGIDEEDLVEIQGAQGPFWITSIGGKPELEDGFFYGDAKHQFFFYANIKVIEGKKFDIDVFEPSSGPSFVGSELDVIERNITQYFRERQFFNQSKLTTESDKQNLRSVLFAWRVRR